MESILKDIFVASVPILVALVGIIPTVISNRKKTQKTMEEIQQDNSETLKSLKNNVQTINDDIEKLRNMLEGHIREDEWNTMKQARVRIIRYGDELLQDKHRFSKAHFDEIIDNINVYKTFTKQHPDFVNNKGEASMDFIMQTYDELMRTDGFAR